MFRLDDRIQQLLEFENEHGHMLVAQSYKKHGLGKYVNNMRQRKAKGGINVEDVKVLDRIGFVWVAPRGPEKTKLMEWGKHFSWLRNFQMAKGHCNIPTTIAGKTVPAATTWCDEQRKLYMEGKLEESKCARLSALGFDFYRGTDEPDDDGSALGGPPAKRQRSDSIETMQKELVTLQAELVILKETIRRLAQT